MSGSTLSRFQIFVMDIVEDEHCKTALQYRVVSERLHDALEDAIMHMCMDDGIDDYDPVSFI